MTKHYNDFIERENIMKELFKEELFPKDIRELTSEQVKGIKETIEGLLSPESLYMDGEATQEQVGNTLKHLNMVCFEINANTEYDFKIKDLNY